MVTGTNRGILSARIIFLTSVLVVQDSAELNLKRVAVASDFYTPEESETNVN